MCSEQVTQLQRIRDAYLSQLKLTPRETEIAHLLIKGLSIADIAAGLNLSMGTVKQHMSSIYEAADASSRGEFIGFVFPT